VHDIVDLEARGLPGVFVASTEFVEAARAQQAALGSDVASVFVAHPIQDRSDDEMRALADAAVDELLARLVHLRRSTSNVV
jgi:alkanesulfonate monooxygenase SsuD/methylene tetrahydromethanopterin reductase-like flavin-dependent oxidoreductase (luciferase family)